MKPAAAAVTTPTAAPADAAPTSADRLRQAAVVVAQVACILGTLVGVGVFGTRVEESSGGALAADATLLAPAGPAFSIWSVIYAGLIAFTLWQLLPGRATDERARSLGLLAAASMILNAAWLLVTQQGWLWVSVLVIIALVVVLGVLMRRLHAAAAPSSWWERVIIDGTFGLYLGWVSVAVCANITATLVASGVDPAPPVSEFVAVAVLVVVAALGVFLARVLGGRYAVAAAMVWGLAWLAVGRLSDEPASLLVGIAAISAAGIIALTTIIWRPRGTGRHQP